MYERFFGLVDAPFRLTPDPRYLFLSRKHADALAHLRLGLTESSGFVCITGDVGTGKTTLLRAFLASLGPEVATAYVISPTLSALELLRTINGEFGISAASRSRKKLVDSLNGHLLAQCAAGRRAVVVVDEAQALSVDVLEELRLLSNLETTTEKLLRIVLVGQPQLRALLLHGSLVQLNQRITLRWHVGPLNRAETAAYIRHRLRVAGEGQARRLFTRPALRLIHRLSGGVPRLINMIAHRSLLVAFAAERRRVRAVTVLHAYRELDAVPLPAAQPTARHAAWSLVAAGACLGVLALGAGRIAWAPGSASQAGPTQASLGDTGFGPTPPSPPVEPTPPAPEAAPAEVAGAPATEVASVPPADAGPVGPPAPPPAPPPDVVGRLLALEPAASLRTAVAATLACWQAQPLDGREATTDLRAIAARRGFEHLTLAGNATALRRLDLPAILELRLPGSADTRWVALTALREDGWVLALDGTPVTIDPAHVEPHWFGRAHIFWRDFEGLGGGVLDETARGPRVARLQTLLGRAGLFGGPPTGEYGPTTSAAVLELQRRHFLVPDARVGALTRIVLYAAAGGYPGPHLAHAAGSSS